MRGRVKRPELWPSHRSLLEEDDSTIRGRIECYVIPGGSDRVTEPWMQEGRQTYEIRRYPRH